jgi:5-methylthioadenosine/S-adenosylhomocysteine deaminase
MTSGSTLIKGGTVLTANDAGEILHGASVLVEGNRIARIYPSGAGLPDPLNAEIVEASGRFIIPGFIQTHIHLCQTLFRGAADDLQLLDWLRSRIFPFEAAHDAASMRASAMIGIAELIRSGTTTILDMGSIHHEEEIIRAIGESGLRAFVGKAMMDLNDLYPALRETAAESLASTRRLVEQWHNAYDGRIRYAPAPRFVLSCSDALLGGIREMLASFPDVLLHTHASENRSEIEAVRKRSGMENIEFLNQVGLLSERAALAHCVHLNDNEVDLLKSTRASVSHCPSSNLKLASGIADIPRLLSGGINVALGADGAPCNNTLDMFQEMRLASLLQKPRHGATSMPAETIFRMATRNGAKALGLDREIGSIEAGKKADIVLLNVDNLWDPLDPFADPCSTIVYSAGPANVESVMIDGLWRYRRYEPLGMDYGAIRSAARREFRLLLQRIPR